MNRTSPKRQGFTLLEVLMVIAIIGLLIGLLLPAVNFALVNVRQNAIAMELETISQAVERYRDKYGDYPPDGSDKAVFERHIRKAFPQIAASELVVLYAWANSTTGMTNSVMDPPEALVFFLGGFSDDPVHPFTGPGGPLAKMPDRAAIKWQYNVDRNDPLFEFKQAQLSVSIQQDPSGAPVTLSQDESNYGLPTLPALAGDILPVYRPAGKEAPYTYFDGRTFSALVQTSSGRVREYNRYQSTLFGVARPYRTMDLNTTASDPEAVYRYAEEGKFQVITAGLDDSFGGIPTATPRDPPVFFRFPTGQSLDIKDPTSGTVTTRYKVPGSATSLQLDNVTNFSGGILENSIEE